MSTVVIHRVQPVSARTGARTATAVPRPDASHAAPTEGAVRLTRRGRLVTFLAALALVAVVTVAFGSSVAATGEGSHPDVARTVTVQPGQTLWDLARQADPDADPRVVVDDIVRLNALSGGGDVQPGQKVAIPAY